jgi:hypothetical protein
MTSSNIGWALTLLTPNATATVMADFEKYVTERLPYWSLVMVMVTLLQAFYVV